MALVPVRQRPVLDDLSYHRREEASYYGDIMEQPRTIDSPTDVAAVTQADQEPQDVLQHAAPESAKVELDSWQIEMMHWGQHL
jgi:hypothetical protein